MEKNLKIILLYDLYGEFLTSRQREILSGYYEYDFSLAEIAENLTISRQAVNDALKTATQILLDYEQKLNLLYIKEQLNLALKANAEESKKIICALADII